MIGAREPLRQCETPAGMPPIRLRLRRLPGIARVVQNQGNSKIYRISGLQVISPNENSRRRRVLRYVPESPDSLRVQILVSFRMRALLGGELGEFGVLLFELRIVRRVRGIGVITGAGLFAIFRIGGGHLAAHAAELGVLILDRGDPGLAFRRLDVQHVPRRPRAVRKGGGGNPFFRIQGWLKCSRQLVVVFLEDWVELMVMTARASELQSDGSLD